jgi:2-isopropylmalate synthase
VANALAALEAGATHVQGTINGYGERTGNCNLTSVIPNVALKMKKRCLPGKSLAQLRELSQFVDDIANFRHNPRQPWVGQTAFAHKGGMHVNAVQKVARSYEHIDPALRGQPAARAGQRPGWQEQHRNEGAGAGLQAYERYAGVEGPSSRASRNWSTRAANSRRRKRFAGAAAQQGAASRKTCPSPWMATMSRCGATDRIRSARRPSRCAWTQRPAHTVADGDGPVNALDSALREALAKFYPQVKKVSIDRLQGAHPGFLHRHGGQNARAHPVHRRQGGMGHRGRGDNIIEASLQALIDSMEYRLMK